MNALFFMLPVMLLFGCLFLVFFLISVKSGQYDDLETQKYRIFFED